MAARRRASRRVGGRPAAGAASLGLGLGGHLAHVAADIGQGFDPVQGGRRVARDVGVEQGADRVFIGQADRLAHRFER